MTFSRTTKAIIGAILLIGSALLAKLAGYMGLIDGDMMRRLFQITLGLSLVVLANGAPKRVGRPRASLQAEGLAQKARRAAGWSLTLSGLIYTGVWIFLPIGLATTVSILVVAIGLTFAVLYSIAACRSGSAQPSKLSDV